MYITISIDQKTDERATYFGFELANHENKNFNIDSFQSFYCKKDSQNKDHYFVNVKSPIIDEVGTFEISEETCILIIDELCNYLSKEDFKRVAESSKPPFKKWDTTVEDKKTRV